MGWDGGREWAQPLWVSRVRLDWMGYTAASLGLPFVTCLEAFLSKSISLTSLPASCKCDLKCGVPSLMQCSLLCSKFYVLFRGNILVPFLKIRIFFHLGLNDLNFLLYTNDLVDVVGSWKRALLPVLCVVEIALIVIFSLFGSFKYIPFQVLSFPSYFSDGLICL